MNASIRTVIVQPERRNEGPIRVERLSPDASGVVWVEVTTEERDHSVELLVTPDEARRLAQALLTVAGE